MLCVRINYTQPWGEQEAVALVESIQPNDVTMTSRRAKTRTIDGKNVTECRPLVLRRSTDGDTDDDTIPA